MSGHPIGAEPLLPRSLQPLALIAMREVGADGYAIYQLGPGSGIAELKSSCGAPVPDAGLDDPSVGSFALHAGDTVTGILSFVFRKKAVSERDRSLLERAAAAIDAVWNLSHAPAAYASLAARIGQLETELADLKIADRARGLLTESSPGGTAVDVIARHVETVLRPTPVGAQLNQTLRDLEEDLVERRLTAQAKALLQSRLGMSEEQAHVHLRHTSRKARKPLRDVALELIEG